MLIETQYKVIGIEKNNNKYKMLWILPFVANNDKAKPPQSINR